jgi:hypothetical protein
LGIGVLLNAADVAGECSAARGAAAIRAKAGAALLYWCAAA